jgi:hypothetical protein
VLFRGKCGSRDTKNLIRRDTKGIIGLPPFVLRNRIPACVIVVDMENAEATKDPPDEQRGIFMVDASRNT